MRRVPTAIAALAVAAISAASAAQAQIVSTEGATLVPADPAQLYRIEDGLFRIQGDQVVELTDRSVLFTISYDAKNERGSCYVNGGLNYCQTGARFNFKSGFILSRGRSSRIGGIDENNFADKSQCFLDVVSFQEVKGAPFLATFRLSCF